MFIEKIDYATNAVVATSIQGNMSVATAPSSPESGLVGGNTPFKIVTMPMGSSYHVFVTGMKSGTKDNQIYSVINQNSSTVNVRVKDKDIWLLSFDDNLSLVFDKSFDKAAISYPGSIVYPEAGPYSARTLSTSPVGTSTGASAYLNAAVNNDERGFDLELTQDGNLVVAALVNFIGVYNYLEGNGDKIVCNAGGFPDPHRSSWGTAYNYDEYTDGDAYLLKIDPNTGSLIWSKNVSHFSSKDFYPQVSQHCNGDYIVAGSSADYNTTDYLEPNSYDALTLETPDMPNTSSSPDHIWRKAFHAVGAATNFCLFGLRPTADGGFVVCGDNTPYGSVVKDKFTVTKLSPNPYDGINYDIPYSFAEGQTISGNTTWSPISWGKSDLYIARQIIIPAGVTLTIQNMNLHFAGADQLTDYWYFSTSMSIHQCGILVQPGGKLVVNNSILQGINTCHPFGITDQRQMWDGVVVAGDETQQQTASNQGTIVLNGSTIKDARVATSLASASRFDVADPSVGVSTVASTNYSSRYYLTNTKMGGIANMQNSTILDCRFGVSFWEYHDPILPGNPNLSSFNNNHFTNSSLGMADPLFYARETDGGREAGMTMLALYGVDGVSVKDNQFYCDPSFAREYRTDYGIIGYGGADISASGSGNSFSHLHNGISYLGIPGANVYPLTIANNLFDDNQIALGLSGSMMSATVYQNDFRIPDIPPTYGSTLPTPIPDYPGIGIDLAGSHGYSVTENKFNYCPSCGNGTPLPLGDIGIVVNNAHDEDDIIQANTFDALTMPATALMRNGNDVISTSSLSPWTGLQWKCNDFRPTNPYCILAVSTDLNDPISVPPIPATMREHQGECNTNGHDYELANNRFMTLCMGTNTEHLYQDGYVTQQVDYPYFDDPLNYPELNPKIACSGPLYNVYPCLTLNGTYSYSTACNPAPPQRRAAEIRQVLQSTFTPSTDLTKAKSTGTTALSTEQSLLLADLARSYSKMGDFTTAASVLDSFGLYAAAMPFYIQARRWNDAQRLLSLLPNTTKAEQQYQQLMTICLQLLPFGNTWADADSSQTASIISLATEVTPSPAVYLARGIRSIYHGAEYRWLVPSRVPKPYVAQQKMPTAVAATANGNSDFVVYPNPSNGTFTVEANTAGVFTLYDITGTKMASFQIMKGNNSVKFPSLAPAGVYFGKYLAENGGDTKRIKLIFQP